MAFDPDAFLSTPVATEESPKGFDPDQFLSLPVADEAEKPEEPPTQESVQRQLDQWAESINRRARATEKIQGEKERADIVVSEMDERDAAKDKAVIESASINPERAFHEGMEAAKGFTGNKVVDKATGILLGTTGVVASPLAPVAVGLQEVPKAVQAVSEAAGGDPASAQATLTGDREVLPDLQPAMSDTGSPKFDTLVNMASDLYVMTRKDPVNMALIAEGGIQSARSLSQIAKLRRGLVEVGGRVKFNDTPSNIAEKTEQTFQEKFQAEGQEYLKGVVERKKEAARARYEGMSDAKLQKEMESLSKEYEDFRSEYSGPVAAREVDIASRMGAVAGELKTRGITVDFGKIPTPGEAPAPAKQPAAVVETSEPPAAPDVAPKEAPPSQPPLEMVQGATTEVKGTKGERFSAVYVALPRDIVQASHKGENFAPNPEYPLENTRNYEDPAEGQKVIDIRNNFDPKEHVTDTVSSAAGPVMIAEVIKPDGASTMAVLGGNGRKQAIDLLDDNSRQILAELFNERRERFGLKKDLKPGQEVFRFLGTYDLRKPGMAEELKRISDSLNPSPGLVQSVAKMAEVDATANIPVQELAAGSMDVSPKQAQQVIATFINKGMVDRNLRTPLMQSESSALDYVQRLYVNAAFQTPSIAEFRQSAKESSATGKGMVDAAVPVLLKMRAAGRDALADQIAKAFSTVIDYVNKQGMGKIQNALKQAAAQIEMGTDSAVIQDIAQAMSNEVVMSGKGVNAEATVEGFKQLFQSIGEGVNQFNPGVDLFGGIDTMEDAIRRGLALHRRLKSKGEKLEPEAAVAAEGGRARLSLPKVRLTGKELGSNLTIGQLRDAVRKFAERFLGTSVKNRLTGFQIVISKTGIKKTLSHGTKVEHVLSTIALPKLLENARLQKSVPDQEGRNTIRAVHHFASNIEIAGKPMVANMIVRETTGGTFFYDHDVSKIIEPTGISGEGSLHSDRPAVGSTGTSDAPEGAPSQTSETFPSKGNLPPETGTVNPRPPDVGTGLKAFDAKGNPYADVPLGGLEHVRPAEMPEVMRLAKELGVKFRLKKLPSSRGYFKGMGSDRLIVLDPRIFDNPVAAAKTLAHEVGHLGDYIPDETMKRGNLIGRIMSLRKFLKDRFSPGSASNKAIREELIALTRYWKPWESDKVPNWYDKYRKSSVELYADAISVLFNSPKTLKEMAPTFYKEFFRHLNSKPEFRAEFEALQTLLAKEPEALFRYRVEDVHRMFGDAEEVFLRKMDERRLLRSTFRGFYSRIRQHLLDNASPIIDKQRSLEKQGVAVADDLRMDFLFGEHPLAENKVYLFLDKMWKEVVQPIEAVNFTLKDVGDYLLWQRIANERYEVTNKLAPDSAPEVKGRSVIANPLGYTPETSLFQLQEMAKQHGAEHMALLAQAAQKFHDSVYNVVKDAADAGLINRTTFDTIITPNKNTYATFVPIEYVDVYVPSGIYKQAGTLNEIQNPFHSTVLKTITMLRATQYQRAKATMVRFMQEYLPAEISKADLVWDGKRMISRPPKEPEKTLLELKEDGLYTAFVVEKDIASVFEQVSPANINPITNLLEWSFKTLFHPLFIRYNPAFQLFSSPIRDFQRSYLNAPNKMTAVKLAREYMRSFGAAKARVRGESHPLIQEMLENAAIASPYDSFARGLERKDAFEAMLQQYHILPTEQKSKFIDNHLVSGMTWFFRKVEFYGQVFESLPKIGTYRFLTKDMAVAPRDAAHYVRNHIGMPFSLRKGKHANILGSIVPFYSVFVNGYRDDLRLATKGYGKTKSAGSWWVRWAMTSGIWTAMKAFAALGLFGAGLKKIFDGASEYNKTNYHIIPLGTMPGGEFGEKAVYWRLPQEEQHRMINGVLYKSITMAGKAMKGEPHAGVSDIFAFGAGQFPGMNPVISISAKWKSFLEGFNPRDDFRDRSILSNSEWLAGGAESLKPMLSWTWDQSGLGNFVKYSPDADTTVETSLALVPILNKTLMVSDYGYREIQSMGEKQEDIERAELRVSLKPSTQELLSEYYYLRGLGQGDRNDFQSQRFGMLSAWYTSIYKPFAEAITNDPDNAADYRAQLGENSEPYTRKNSK